MYQEYLKIGVIQTVINPHTTWIYNNDRAPEMSTLAAEQTWNDIEMNFRAINEMNEMNKPEIIILPEFSIPLSKQSLIDKYSKKLKAIIIGGLDFRKSGNNVINEAYVSIPSKWPFNQGNGRAKSFKFGKKFPSDPEINYIKEYANHVRSEMKFAPAQNIYILNLGSYGYAGLAICADFYDLERYEIYRGRIQHLFLIAFNKDLESFRNIAESISRIVYCNVVLCNCGFYGGSLVFHPAYESFERYIYRHEGANLHTLQVLKIPVKRLLQAQSGKDAKSCKLKSLPPGYQLKLPIESDSSKFL